MIEIRVVDGLTCPYVICDSCGEPITDAKGAAAVFKNFITDGERCAVLHVHKNFVKGDCMSKAEASVCSSGGRSGWEELGRHLAYLAVNTGLTPHDLEKHLA